MAFTFESLIAFGRHPTFLTENYDSSPSVSKKSNQKLRFCGAS
jgi:hypothetical protein